MNAANAFQGGCLETKVALGFLEPELTQHRNDIMPSHQC